MPRATSSREFTKYVGLSVLAMVCVSIYILADTWFISRALGTYGLTALNISIAVFGIVNSFGLMVGIGGATHYAIQKSKGVNADAVFAHALAHGLFFSAIFVAAGVFLTPQVARLLGAEGEVLPMAISYMRTILLFSPVLVANNILVAFVRNDSNPKLAMAGMGTASIANIILDYIFLFPMDLGMFGAALATGLAFSLSLVIVSAHFLTRNNNLILRRCKIRIREMLTMDFLGSSALINELAFAISLIAFNLVILGIEGNVGVAAYSVVANIAVIVFAIFTGVAQGIQPLISKGHGLGDRALVNQTLKYALATVCAISLLVYGVLYFNANNIVSAFNSESDATFAQLATHGLRVYFIGLLFAGVNFIASAFFSAIGSAKEAVVVSILRSCVIIIPLVVVLGSAFGIGGVWSAFIATEFAVALVSAALLCVKFKSMKRLSKAP